VCLWGGFRAECPGGWLGNRSVDGVTAVWDRAVAGFGRSEPQLVFPMPSRNWMLLAFMLATYPIAPVLGFAWLLCVICLAQCQRRDGVAASAVFSFFMLSQLIGVPWRQMLSS
jgi:hypothetical protein